MTGTTQKAETGWFEDRIPVRTFVEADSMDEAFERARAVYGSGITGAQVASPDSTASTASAPSPASTAETVETVETEIRIES
ncbi:MAG: hypothetical protein IJ608_05320 [Lachnospiraceae bacterium]|nr:hypothetical protein [Lachnospiraceae bacterium]